MNPHTLGVPTESRTYYTRAPELYIFSTVYRTGKPSTLDNNIYNNVNGTATLDNRPEGLALACKPTIILSLRRCGT